MKLVDSNILIYSVDNDEKDKHPIAKKILLEIIEDKIEIGLSTQNLSEFISVTTKKIPQPISLENAREIILKLTKLSNLKILKINEETILMAIEISEKYSIHYWDALIAAVMKENNIHEIITENEKDFNKIPWITTTNPFN
tara:strand:+ start:216 stop:638 length:423 start_codon:yes stop_codon:yes gene_type:complete